MMMNIEQALNWLIDNEGDITFGKPEGSDKTIGICITAYRLPAREIAGNTVYISDRERKDSIAPIVCIRITKAVEQIRDLFEGEGWRRTHAPKSTL